MRSLFLQDEYGQVLEATSISAGLDYPGVGPEHAMLAAQGRAEYHAATDDEALDGFQLLAATEGIVPALEPAHAIGWLAREAGHAVPTGSTVLVTLSGRGDKDAAQVAERLGELEPELPREPRGAPARAARRRAASCSFRTSPAGSGASGATSCAPSSTRGADAVEVGIPFSDPIMDGRTIQEASQRALDLGATPIGVIDAIAELDVAVPLVVMTYYNLVARARARALRAAPARRRASTARSFPTSRSTSSTAGATRPTRPASRPCCSPRRRRPTTGSRAICERSRGFVYGVSLLGVTGERERARRARRADGPAAARPSPTSPCSSASASRRPTQAAQAAASADGVIVGSALVRRLLDGGGPDEARAFVAVAPSCADLGTSSQVERSEASMAYMATRSRCSRTAR